MAKFKIENLISPMDFCDFIDNFSKINNLKMVGSGVCANVMANKNSNDCYKIGRVEKKSGEDAYIEFLKLVLKKKDNPFFPKIISITMFNNAKSKECWYVVRMEKLLEWKVNKEKKYHPMMRMVRFLLEDCKSEEIKQFSGFLETLSVSSKIGKDLVEALETINKSFDLASPDLHSGNMMLRSNGELVITDPVFGLKKKSKRKP